MRASVLTLLCVALAPWLPGPVLADDIGRDCGPGASGVIQVGASRACLRSGGWTAAPAASGADALVFRGRSRADALLRGDTMDALLIFLAAKGCSRIQTIDSSVISDRPANVIHGRHWWKENWLARGCGKSFASTVLFTADGKGGTFYRITPAL